MSGKALAAGVLPNIVAWKRSAAFEPRRNIAIPRSLVYDGVGFANSAELFCLGDVPVMEIVQSVGVPESKSAGASLRGCPCVMVIFGASGDLTKRLLMPALYNLACDGLLPRQFAVVGTAMDDLTTETFRERMTQTSNRSTRDRNSIRRFGTISVRGSTTRPAKFDDEAAFSRLRDLVARLDAEYGAGGNVLFYFATPPSCLRPDFRQPRSAPASSSFPAGSESSSKNRSASICRRQRI